jgi:hypothetical protein
MPQIIVTATSEHEIHEGKVLLRERVNATDFESERFTANLLERLGWAVEDATEAEKGPRETPRPAAPQRRSASVVMTAS